ncbi:hypothetical protein CGZ90_04240 [Fictibacillus aquaticus]|uniref:Uncharacterized protein n=1 Tax=Fictibacillus aquaticus TaxID=2021314 RepID=A0A235FDV3_9BACL|nr:hypothetical protein CGZ90_04240 [Fictibacillus aquaticus]
MQKGTDLEISEEVDLRFRCTLSAGRGEKQKRLVQPRPAKGKGAGKSLFDLLDTCPFDLEGLAVFCWTSEPSRRYAPLRGLTFPLVPQDKEVTQQDIARRKCELHFRGVGTLHSNQLYPMVNSR